MHDFKKDDVLIGRDYEYPEGALIVHEVLPDGTVKAFPKGGGFQMTFKPESIKKNKIRRVTEEEMKPKFRQTKFTMDSLAGSYEGWTTGDNWNGWATPAFTKEVGLELMAEMNKDEHSSHGRFDEERDAFIFRSEHDDEDYVIEGVDIVINGKKRHLYEIGSWCWCWMEEEETDGDQDQG